MNASAGLMSNLGGAFIIFIIVSVAVIIALRVVLPFSIFKIRELSEELLEEQKKTNEMLGALLKELGKNNTIKEPESDGSNQREEPFN
jgi:hypothetical protein